MERDYEKVLLTGAAGAVGRRVREFLASRCRLRSTDIRRLEIGGSDTTVMCDLGDLDEIRGVVRGIDAIVHLAAIPRDADIADIARANLISTWNLFEAAKEEGVKRVVFASSNHVTGFYSPRDLIGVHALLRPDGIYGASEVFGEAIGRLFWDKHGIECVCLRIGSVLDRPKEPRHLSTWISPRDLNQLIWRCLVNPAVGFTVAYGISDNARAWWNNEESLVQGYHPEDRSEDYANEILKDNDGKAGLDTLVGRFQGGPWAESGYSKLSMT
jgi:uronate dehydrogenase